MGKRKKTNKQNKKKQRTRIESQERGLTERGARRWGHLSRKTRHSPCGSFHTTSSLPRSWNGVGTEGSKSSIKDTGYQWSRHTNASSLCPCSGCCSSPPSVCNASSMPRLGSPSLFDMSGSAGGRGGAMVITTGLGFRTPLTFTALDTWFLDNRRLRFFDGENRAELEEAIFLARGKEQALRSWSIWAFAVENSDPRRLATGLAYNATVAAAMLTEQSSNRSPQNKTLPLPKPAQDFQLKNKTTKKTAL